MGRKLPIIAPCREAGSQAPPAHSSAPPRPPEGGAGRVRKVFPSREVSPTGASAGPRFAREYEPRRPIITKSGIDFFGHAVTMRGCRFFEL